MTRISNLLFNVILGVGLLLTVAFAIYFTRSTSPIVGVLLSTVFLLCLVAFLGRLREINSEEFLVGANGEIYTEPGLYVGSPLGQYRYCGSFKMEYESAILNVDYSVEDPGLIMSAAAPQGDQRMINDFLKFKVSPLLRQERNSCLYSLDRLKRSLANAHGVRVKFSYQEFKVTEV